MSGKDRVRYGIRVSGRGGVGSRVAFNEAATSLVVRFGSTASSFPVTDAKAQIGRQIKLMSANAKPTRIDSDRMAIYSPRRWPTVEFPKDTTEFSHLARLTPSWSSSSFACVSSLLCLVRTRRTEPASRIRGPFWIFCWRFDVRL